MERAGNWQGLQITFRVRFPWTREDCWATTNTLTSKINYCERCRCWADYPMAIDSGFSWRCNHAAVHTNQDMAHALLSSGIAYRLTSAQSDTRCVRASLLARLPIADADRRKQTVLLRPAHLHSATKRELTCTSSTIMSAPVSSQSSRTAAKYSGVAGTTPPSPCDARNREDGQHTAFAGANLPVASAISLFFASDEALRSKATRRSVTRLACNLWLLLLATK